MLSSLMEDSVKKTHNIQLQQFYFYVFYPKFCIKYKSVKIPFAHS